MSGIVPYRLAYNVFHLNLQRFGIPEDNIPPPKTEKVPDMDHIIPRLSIAAVLYQICSRSTLKPLIDESPTVYNLGDLYRRYTSLMNESLSKDSEEQNDDVAGVPEDATSENVSQTIEKSVDVEIPQDSEQYLPTDALKVCSLGLPCLTVDSVKFLESCTLIVYSLAVCTELILYERKNENNKAYLKEFPVMWEKYFNEELGPLCKGIELAHLRQFSDGVFFPEAFLNEFLSENKNEYYDIGSKFVVFCKEKDKQLSPTGSSGSIDDVSFSEKLHFSEIKKTFKALKEIGKCWLSNDQSSPDDNQSSNDKSELVPLLNDYSPSTPSPLAEAGSCNYGYDEKV